MKQRLNEVKRMQQLAGILKENEESNAANKVADKVEDSLEAKVDRLSPEQVQKLQSELTKLGITADTPAEEVINKIEGPLSEAEGDQKQKIANALSNIGSGLMTSLLVPLIPVAIGTGTGIGFAGGLGVTMATAGLLIGLAKALGKKEGSTEHGNN
jgi:hypothetical protein